MAARWIYLLVLHVLATTVGCSDVAADNSLWYDWGVYGAYPQLRYESFGAASPWPNILKSDPACDDGYIFIGPRGPSVETPGPIVIDQRGNLVWMDTQWGQAMDVKVQPYRGDQYITFWHGSDNGTFGEGYYLMLDSSYDVFKNITAVGGVTGDLHEFRITNEDTALFTVYEKVPSDLSAYGIDDGWIIDSLFQEIDVETGELIFQWRASDYYPVTESMAPIGSFGVKDNAFDFFHINSIDKDAAGNYLISSRYMCGVAYVSASSGDVLWQLGGSRNNFTDLSGGAATDMTWQHHAVWAEGNDTLTVFDNGAYNKLATAEYSRGLLIALDRDNMTATLLQDYVAPQRLLVPSQGSVQQLPGGGGGGGNVLVGWGHTPAFTEFSAGGEALCDVHIGAVHLAWLGRCKNYRTFKFPWVGRPKTPPSAAMRPREDALYVSWNGATEVDRWVLQSGDGPAEGEGDGGFVEHDSVAREGRFETRIVVPADAGDFVRVAALDGEGEVLGYSEAVSKRVETEIAPMYAPPRPRSWLSILPLVGGCVLGLVALVLLWRYRGRIRGVLTRLRWRSAPKAKYEMLPLNERD